MHKESSDIMSPAKGLRLALVLMGISNLSGSDLQEATSLAEGLSVEFVYGYHSLAKTAFNRKIHPHVNEDAYLAPILLIEAQIKMADSLNTYIDRVTANINGLKSGNSTRLLTFKRLMSRLPGDSIGEDLYSSIACVLLSVTGNPDLGAEIFSANGFAVFDAGLSVMLEQGEAIFSHLMSKYGMARDDAQRALVAMLTQSLIEVLVEPSSPVEARTIPSEISVHERILKSCRDAVKAYTSVVTYYGDSRAGPSHSGPEKLASGMSHENRMPQDNRPRQVRSVTGNEPNIHGAETPTDAFTRKNDLRDAGLGQSVPVASTTSHGGQASTQGDDQRREADRPGIATLLKGEVRKRNRFGHFGGIM